jgi:hypothetical protein
MSLTSEPARVASSRVRITMRTLRRDRWWLQPALTELCLLAFVAYSTWAAFQNDAPMACQVSWNSEFEFLFRCVNGDLIGVAGLRTRQGWATRAGSYQGVLK